MPTARGRALLLALADVELEEDDVAILRRAADLAQATITYLLTCSGAASFAGKALITVHE